MKENDNEWVGLSVLLVYLPLVLFRAFIALTIAGWFSPWPIPVGAVQLTGLYIAGHALLFRYEPSDDRTPLQRLQSVLINGFVIPVICLGCAVVVRLML